MWSPWTMPQSQVKALVRIGGQEQWIEENFEGE